MRKILFFLLLSLSALSCTVREVSLPGEGRIFEAAIEAPEASRTYMDASFKVFWNQDDEISIFDGTDLNRRYRFLGDDGAQAGKFGPAGEEPSEGGNAVPAVFAAYPYREDNACSTAGVLSLTLPSEQTYTAGSFDAAAQLMVARGNGEKLYFRQVGSLFGFKICGEGSVKSLSLRSGGGETLAGRVNVTPSDEPVLEFDSSGTSDTVTLTATNPVKLSTEEPAIFWFCLPPLTFSRGFTLSVTMEDGSVYTKSTAKKITLRRAVAHKMETFSLESSGIPAKPGIYLSDYTFIFPGSPWQTSVYEAEGLLWVRYFNPETSDLLQAGPIPQDAAPGDRFNVSGPDGASRPVSVINLEGGIITLASDTQEYFVLRIL